MDDPNKEAYGTMATDSYKLLPCPFCGSNDLTLDNLREGDDWFVSCNSCEIQQIANYTQDGAIRRWNLRVEGPPAMRAAIAIKREYRPLSDSAEKLAKLIEKEYTND